MVCSSDRKRTLIYFGRRCCSSNCYPEMWLKFLLVVSVWCCVMLRGVTAGAAGLHVWSNKHSPEIQAMLRKHQNYQRLMSTPSISVLQRRNGEHRMPTVTSRPPLPPIPKETDFNHLNSFLKSAKNFDKMPYVRRQQQQQNPIPWSSLYSSDNVHTSVKYVQQQPAPSKIEMVETKPSSYIVKSDKNAPSNAAVVVDYPRPSTLSSPPSSSTTKRLALQDHLSAVTSAKDFYKEMYSTEEGVRQIKEEYGPTNLTKAKTDFQVEQELEDVRLANEHFIQMRNTIRCRVPIPEVVCVKDVYSDINNKEYLPRCTLLHRCGDRSGCCDSEDFHCVPRLVQEVALNFYMVHLDYKPNEIPPENTVEKLLFENHTECECVHASEVPPKYQPTTSVLESPLNNVSSPTMMTTTVSPQQHPHQSDDHSNRHSERNGDEKKHKKCGTCPNPFHHREYNDGRCGCDCFDKERPCIRIKRGRDALSEPERRCVEVARCHIPECEYGSFVTSIGRCPKRPEDYDRPGGRGAKQHRNTPSEHHRWNFYERD